MSEIINLKRHRKRVARQDQEQQAEANRQKFGRSKPERETQAAEAGRAQRHLDGHKRES